MSLALMDATNQVSRFMRESVDGRIEIRQLGEHQFGQEELSDDSESPITQDTIHQIMALSEVAVYNAHSRGLASSDSLTFSQGITSSASDNMGSIRGVNSSSLLSDFQDNRLSLIDGRHITAEDENVVMISETLARQNDLSIGNTIALRPAQMGINDEGKVIDLVNENNPTIAVKIIGIYSEEEVQVFGLTQPSANITANQLFTDHKLMTSLGVAKVGEYEAVTFHVKDPDELPEVVQEIRQLEELDWDHLFMQHDDGDYMSISADLKTVQNLIFVILVTISIVSAIILTLILILRMRGRVHEVGILLSVGISKNQILGGFLLEIIIIALLSFITSYASTNLLIPTLLANFPVITGIEHFQFQTISLARYGLVYFLTLLIILMAAYFSTLVTIRLQPKQILTTMQ
jgi:ABC-type lipoprotein release transport system permease subunit